MKLGDYERILACQTSRRTLLHGAAALGAAATGAAALGATAQPARAQAAISADERALRRQIVKVPGVGHGSPTDADWQKVGALCLGRTKARVKPGEFKGVKLTFMGLNNQNLHDFLFRGFLKPWEAYTGAAITWIDLAQADYNPGCNRRSPPAPSISTFWKWARRSRGMSAARAWPRRCQTGSSSRSISRTTSNIGSRRSAPGTARSTAPTIDGDTHNFNYRTDYFADANLAKAWKQEGHKGEWGVPKTWQQVQEVTKFLKGKKIKGQDVYGYLDAPKPWGGFRLLFPRQPGHGLRKASKRKGVAVRRGHHEAAGQQSGLGARHQG